MERVNHIEHELMNYISEYMIMKCLTGFMRTGCEKRRLNEISMVDKANDLGAMVEAVAPKLFCGRLLRSGGYDWNCNNSMVD